MATTLTTTTSELRKRVGSWQLAVGSGQWAVGSWQWAVGSWQLAVGSWQLAVGSGEWGADFLGLMMRFGGGGL